MTLKCHLEILKVMVYSKKLLFVERNKVTDTYFSDISKQVVKIISFVNCIENQMILIHLEILITF